MSPSHINEKNLQDWNSLSKRIWQYLAYHHHDADTTDAHKFFLPSVPTDHRYNQVLKTASSVYTELKNAFFCWSGNISASIYWRPLKNVIYESVLTSLAMLIMSGSFDLDALWDGRSVTVQLLFSKELFPRFVQNIAKYFCAVRIYLFLEAFR